MTTIIGALTILCILMFLVTRAKKEKKSVDTWPLYPKKPISEAEQIFFYRLQKALPDNLILAQVQLSRFIGVKKGFDFHEWNNRINRMSIDFLVCRKDATIMAAIELDDSSHEKPESQKRDEKKNRVMKDAGIRLIRCHVRQMPDEVTIRNLIDNTHTGLP